MNARGAAAVLANATLAATYFAGGKLGLSLAFVHASATAVWPPTGIALAALLLFGRRMWPGVFLGAFLVNLTTAGSVVSSLGIATGNTLEAVIGATLVSAFANGVRAFERPQDVFKFALLAAFVSPVASATIGVGSLSLTGFARWEEFGAIWLTWWLGDAGGALVVAPALVLWWTSPRRPLSRERLAELAALALALVFTAYVVFGAHPFADRHYPITFLSFPVLVWAAFRFGLRESATATLLLAALAVWGTLQGHGPFAAAPVNEALLLLQSFMGAAAVMTLALAAAELQVRVAEERKIAEREEFLAVAAHELRTPLTSLRMAAQLLARDLAADGRLDTDRLALSLGAIDQQSARLARLITELLETVRLRTGAPAMDVQVADEDVAAIVGRAVAAARAASPRHEFVLRAPERLPARTDGVRIEQVVDNLLDNAVKFSPRGGRVEVDLEASDGWVRLAVRDRGIGISAAERPHLFDRFYRSSRHDERSGLGLGLYVSKRIVERLGGSIAVETPDGGGARFVVRLPWY